MLFPGRRDTFYDFSRMRAHWNAFECSVMLSGKPPAENAGGGGDTRNKKQRGERNNETSSIHQGRERRSGCGRGCFTGGRAIDAGAEMASDSELAEVARHFVWRLRGVRESSSRGDRQQIPDPDIRCRRSRAGVAGARCRFECDRRDRTHSVLLLFRQGPDLRLSARPWRSARTSASTKVGSSTAAAAMCSTSSTKSTMS